MSTTSCWSFPRATSVNQRGDLACWNELFLTGESRSSINAQLTVCKQSSYRSLQLLEELRFVTVGILRVFSPDKLPESCIVVCCKIKYCWFEVVHLLLRWWQCRIALKRYWIRSFTALTCPTVGPLLERIRIECIARLNSQLFSKTDRMNIARTICPGRRLASPRLRHHCFNLQHGFSGESFGRKSRPSRSLAGTIQTDRRS